MSGTTARRAIDLFASTVSLIFMAAFAWMLLARFPAVQRAHQLTSDLKLPIWPFYAIAAIGIVAAAVVGLIRLIELIRGDAEPAG
jgi:TRAP-type C4-dicarboxylate transport system permease small subunit